MKPTKSLLLVFVFAIILVSCESETKKENAQLKATLVKLQEENAQYKDRSKKLTANIENYKKILAEIDKNLADIEANNTMVGQLGTEVKAGGSVVESIRTRMANIKALVENSKVKILILDRNLNALRKTSNQQSEEILTLDRELKSSTGKLIEQEKAYLDLVAGLENEIEDLEKAYEDQLAVTEELKKILNRAYYIAGSAKQLKDKGVVDAEGGFIGIGRVKVLNANSTDEMFTRIEKDKTDSITFTGKKIKLITSHPEGTFELRESKDGSALKVLNKKDFWKNSNYLVVQAGE